MTKEYKQQKSIVAVDCCEHVLSALRRGISNSNLISFNTKNTASADFPINDTDLIVVGVSNVPARRLFISRLRRFYPEVPMLVLRRENIEQKNIKDQIRGEFVISDTRHQDDLELIKVLRRVLPLKFCHHTKPEYNYDLLRDVTRIISENYSDPELNLTQVARELPTSPAKLSRILNKQVGISFRQLLKQIRIEEAKRMLASHKYSVKEVAARVGFSDSHYFSRSFKEMTGLNATEFRHSPNDLIFN
ncbi:MAG: AraC-type DNA-binding protein [Acidobacteria bacterium]|jgi:AraC-like DNA-binding protein|nr:AraC-type DNA-binding protein [Acidobacteriota bacterium]